MAKKPVVEDPVVEEQQVDDRQVKNITRVARMLLFRQQNPNAETNNFDDSIEDYKYLWRKIPKDHRPAVIKAALLVPDMDKDLVAAAVAVLEPANGSR